MLVSISTVINVVLSLFLLFQWYKNHAREEAVKNGVLKTEDWSEYDLTKPVMTLSEVSGEKVQAAYRLAYRKFYMRPRYVLKKLFGVRTVADVRSIFSGLKGVLNVVGR